MDIEGFLKLLREKMASSSSSLDNKLAKNLAKKSKEDEEKVPEDKSKEDEEKVPEDAVDRYVTANTSKHAARKKQKK